MNTRTQFDTERLSDAAHDAIHTSLLPSAQCVYVPRSGRVIRHTTVPFEWQLELAGHKYQQVVEVRADNAVLQSVPLPKSWRIALACSSLDEIADRFAAEQITKLGLGISYTIFGRLAGMPEAACTPGTVVALKTPGGARKDFLLCARVALARLNHVLLHYTSRACLVPATTIARTVQMCASQKHTHCIT